MPSSRRSVPCSTAVLLVGSNSWGETAGKWHTCGEVEGSNSGRGEGEGGEGQKIVKGAPFSEPFSHSMHHVNLH